MHCRLLLYVTCMSIRALVISLLFLCIIIIQLRVYAKFNEPNKVDKDTTARASAICDTDLEDAYYTITILYDNNINAVLIFCTVLFLLPLIFITITATIVRSLHKEIHKGISKHVNHKNVVGLALMGHFM